MKKLSSLIKALLDAKSSVSSKRFLALQGFQFILLAIVMDIFYKKTLTEFMWTGLLFFVAALLGMNTFITAKAMGTKESISSQIIDKEPDDTTAETAKEVLQSDKP